MSWVYNLFRSHYVVNEAYFSVCTDVIILKYEIGRAHV